MSTCEELPLIGKRFLILEDEPLIAMDIEQILRDAGAELVELCTALDADELKKLESYDAAVLDLNIGGRSSVPVAEALKRHDIPFIVVSGSEITPESAILSSIPLIDKPFDPEELLRGLCGELQKTSQQERARA